MLRSLLLALALLATPAAAQHSPAMQGEHDAFVALAGTAETVIPAGQSITYSAPTAAQFVRIDGHLTVAAALDVDTILVMPGGTLEVLAGATITIRDNGPLDTTRDPARLSRGIVSHGNLVMHGDAKAARARVEVDPLAGDGALTLETAPAGWQAGDRIVIAGTRYPAHGQPQDEVRTVVAVVANIVTLDAPLTYDHDAPRPDLKTWVANVTRSTVVRSENGVSLPPGQRGHVMCMHSGCEVSHVAFEHMGRTDKSLPFSAENVPGRYPLHCHRAATACEFEGNAVWTSPGWGIVHHDSAANLTGNVVYGAFGAGIVAESGTETGAWTNNLVIWSEGVDWRDPKSLSGDPITAGNNFGVGGDGYWFQGRMVDASGNVAASVNTGFAYFHRGDVGDGLMMRFDSAVHSLPGAFWNRPHDDANFWNEPGAAPILTFANNEVLAAQLGLTVVKSNPYQGHDVHSRLVGFTAWHVLSGLRLEYTSHYTFTDLDLTGIPGASIGAELTTNVSAMTFVNPWISGFSEGVRAHRNFTPATVPDPANPGYLFAGGTMANNGADFVGVNASEIVAIPAPSPLTVALDPLVWPGPLPLAIQGTVTDAFGARAIPSQGDLIGLGGQDVQRMLETHGLWDAPGGGWVMLLPVRFSDRLTGLSHEVVVPVTVPPDTWLGSPFYANVPMHGPLPDDAPTVEELQAQIAALEAENAALAADLSTALGTIADLEARISDAVTALTGP